MQSIVEGGGCSSRTYYSDDQSQAKKMHRMFKESGNHVVQFVHAKMSESGKFEVKVINFI